MTVCLLMTGPFASFADVADVPAGDICAIIPESSEKYETATPSESEYDFATPSELGSDFEAPFELEYDLATPSESETIVLSTYCGGVEITLTADPEAFPDCDTSALSLSAEQITEDAGLKKVQKILTEQAAEEESTNASEQEILSDREPEDTSGLIEPPFEEAILSRIEELDDEEEIEEELHILELLKERFPDSDEETDTEAYSAGFADLAAFDISVLSDGGEVQPDKEVELAFSGTENVLDTESDIAVYHIIEPEELPEIAENQEQSEVTEKLEKLEQVNGEADLTVVTDHFSTYVLTEEETVGSNVHPPKDEVYNLSKAKINTRLIYSQPGDYYLTGSTNHVVVQISGNGVRLHLDNVSITTGALSNIGKATASIVIDNFDGECEIITAGGSENTVDGYLGQPAILKNGIKSRLIFSTDEPDNPGYLYAAPSRLMSTVAIGSDRGSRDSMKKQTTGNIVFNSGRVTAVSYSAAGIGGAKWYNVDGITINGGTVKAYGGASEEGAFSAVAGAGIGTTSGPNHDECGLCDNITINGGNVYAKGGKMAEPESQNLPYTAAGIGGGMYGDVGNITITGGYIKAEGAFFETRKGTENNGASGIGGGGYCMPAVNHVPEVKGTITITGGEIDAYGRARSPGIGAAANKGSIVITGGFVKAHSDDITGIYANNMTITGGTIHGANCNITSTVSGGSVVSGNPVKGDRKLTTIGFADYYGEIKEEAVLKTGITGLSEPYGLKDVIAQDGKLYFYLPDGAAVTSVTLMVDETPRLYTGHIEAGNEGILGIGTQLRLARSPYAAAEGSAAAEYGSNQIRDFNPVIPAAGEVLLGYDSPEGIRVLDADGKLAASAGSYTDAAGCWIRNDSEITLTAKIIPSLIHIKYDANVPESTAGTAQGSMPYNEYQYDASVTLAANAYKLQGYSFTGWNTKKDGSGTSYADRAVLSGIPAEAEDFVLYAQWQAKTYTVSFASGGGSGTMEPQTLTYDRPESLNTCTFTKSGSVFVGWQKTALGASAIADGADVVNICSYNSVSDSIGDVTLTAVWEEPGDGLIVITEDDTYVPGFEGRIRLYDGSSFYNCFSEVTNGFYRCSSGVPAGNYGVYLYTDGDNAGLCLYTGKDITIGGGAGSFVMLNYYSVEAESDFGAKAYISPAGVGTASADSYYGGTPDSSGHLTGAKVIRGGTVETDLDETTAVPERDFYRWESLESDPEGWQSGIPTEAFSKKARFEIRGKTRMRALSQGYSYMISFDKNKPAGADADVTGTVPNQRMIAGEKASLIPATYALKGYSQDSWNDRQDGSGNVYYGGEMVSFDPGKGGTAVLYAHWTPIRYSVKYSANGGSGSMRSSGFTYGTEGKLNACSYHRDGYVFLNWNTDPSGSGTSYSDGETVKNLCDSEGRTLTLYAQWGREKVSIRYLPGDGEGESVTQNAEWGSTVTLNRCGFTRTGYTFIGWKADAEGSGEIYQAGQKIRADRDMTFTAQWKRNNSRAGNGSSQGSPNMWLKWNGDWYYYSSGTPIRGRWAYLYNPYADVAKGEEPYAWFYFDPDGRMRTGWFLWTDGRWYYLNPVRDNTYGAWINNNR